MPVFLRVRKITGVLISKIHVDALRRNKFLRKIYRTNCVVDFFSLGRLTDRRLFDRKADRDQPIYDRTSDWNCLYIYFDLFPSILLLNFFYSFFFFCFLSFRRRKIKILQDRTEGRVYICTYIHVYIHTFIHICIYVSS